jgi:hypothetical protein
MESREEEQLAMATDTSPTVFTIHTALILGYPAGMFIFV